MTSFVTEFAVFNTTEAYRRNIRIFDAGFALLAEADGLQRIFHGLQSDDHSKGYVINIWDTLEHHTKFTNSDAYGPMIQIMQSGFTGSVEDFHVHFINDPIPILSATCTEITIFRLASRAQKTQVLEILDEMSRMGLNIMTYGEMIEDRNVVVMIRVLLDDQVEIHCAMPQLDALADSTVRRSKLLRFTCQQ